MAFGNSAIARHQRLNALYRKEEEPLNSQRLICQAPDFDAHNQFTYITYS
ncbi:hypothetical protein PL11201_80215 [Planktothrix sp. PCC 11201]|nr:hypothetical protein PL11201_80215 [Planktothrix sp. PCC 11201]